MIIHGIDVLDLMRTFSPTKWDALQNNGHNYVIQLCAVAGGSNNEQGHSGSGAGHGSQEVDH